MPIRRPSLENLTVRTDEASIKSIFRYPVKGLSAESLAETALAVGGTVPADRLYAIENGPSGFDPAVPAYLPKQRFLMLMRNERLASIEASFEEATHTLTLREGGRVAGRGDLRTAAGRAAIEDFFSGFCAGQLRGAPRVLHAPGHSFSDVAKKVVSILNLASVSAIETAVGAPVDPLRFRANLHVEGWPPWHEFDLLGRVLAVGPEVRLKVVKRIGRCAATEVEPGTGIRDLPIPWTLMRNLGHADCGVYAEVASAGRIATGDRIELLAGG